MQLILPGDVYLNLPTDDEAWIIQDLLPVGGLMNIYGDPKVGKSFLCIQLAAAVAGDALTWMGFDVKTHGRVAYIQLDTSHTLWQQRLKNVKSIGVEKVHYGDRQTLDTWPFDIMTPDHARRLSGALQPIAPTLTIIDTLREAHKGDENDSGVMQQVIGRLEHAIKPSALVVVSHSRKPSEAGSGLMIDNRGSNYTAGRMDGIIKLTRKKLYFEGRACEGGTVPMERGPNGLLHVAARVSAYDKVDHEASILDQARQLSGATGDSIEAARSFIRRRQEKPKAPRRRPGR